MSDPDSELPSAAPDRHVALIGMAGTGKSTVGRALARAVGAEFVDLDAAIEKRVGSTVSDIFGAKGEEYFREVEADALADAVARSGRLVIATGGGVVVTEENRELLAERTRCVWLRCEPALLVQRLSTARVARPLIDGDVAANMSRLLDEREGWYQGLADVVCDVDGRDVAGIVSEVSGSLE